MATGFGRVVCAVPGVGVGMWTLVIVIVTIRCGRCRRRESWCIWRYCGRNQIIRYRGDVVPTVHDAIRAGYVFVPGRSDVLSSGSRWDIDAKVVVRCDSLAETPRLRRLSLELGHDGISTAVLMMGWGGEP